MHANIIETLPWIGCGEVFGQVEARGRAAGEAVNIISQPGEILARRKESVQPKPQCVRA
jgi:hypothetical protein